MFEHEVKLRVEDWRAVLELLTSAGFSCVEFHCEDVYFQHPSRDFSKTDEELRLRELKVGDKRRLVLTYKGPSLEDRCVREEIEVEVDCRFKDSLLLLLTRLGFTPAIKKVKRGFLLRRGAIEVQLVDVAGEYRGITVDLGWFAEVELKCERPSPEALNTVRKLAELIGGRVETRYYTEEIVERARKLLSAQQ